LQIVFLVDDVTFFRQYLAAVFAKSKPALEFEYTFSSFVLVTPYDSFCPSFPLCIILCLLQEPELLTLAQADALLTITEEDRDLLSKLVPRYPIGLQKTASPVHQTLIFRGPALGVFHYIASSESFTEIRPSISSRNAIAFIGSDNGINVLSLTWFFEQVWFWFFLFVRVHVLPFFDHFTLSFFLRCFPCCERSYPTLQSW
jgi:hypothetical protein